VKEESLTRSGILRPFYDFECICDHLGEASRGTAHHAQVRCIRCVGPESQEISSGAWEASDTVIGLAPKNERIRNSRTQLTEVVSG